MKRLTLCAAMLALAVPCAAQELSIERLAPEQSIAIVGVSNYAKAQQRWNRTTFPQVMQLDAVKATEDDAVNEAPVSGAYRELIEELFEEFGIEEDPSKVMPTGAMGMALYTHVSADDAGRRAAMLAFADYGENANTMQAVIDRLREEADKGDAIEYEVEDVRGRTVYSFERPEIDTARFDEALDRFNPAGGLPPMVPMPAFDDYFGQMKKAHFTRDGEVFFLCSEMDQLVDTLELIDEQGESPFTDRDDYQGVRAQIGEVDAYGMVFLRPLFQMMAELEPGAAMIPATFQMMVGDVKALGFGVRLDGDTAMLEGSMGVYMPNGKSGMTMLLDRPSPRGDLPAFIGPNVVSFSSFNFDMGGLGKFVKQFVSGNPMLQAEMGQMLPEIEAMLDSISASLGDRMYMYTTQQRPLTIESMGTIVALTCRDAQGFENAISGFAPQMGMQPRDFLGQRIYAMDPGMAEMMGMPGGGPAIGIGGGFVFMGTEQPVQQAMRATGQDDLPTLAGEESFRHAVAGLSDGDVIGWGFVQTVNSMEGSMTAARLQQEQMIEQVRQWDPDMADEMAGDMTDPMKHWDAESLAELRELIGPMTWQIRSTDLGFEMKLFQYRGTAGALN